MVITAILDFFSGLVYECRGMPCDLNTPLFAVSRIAGWCAHRIEEIETCGRIMRPAYRSLAQGKKYVPLDERGLESVCFRGDIKDEKKNRRPLPPEGLGEAGFFAVYGDRSLCWKYAGQLSIFDVVNVF